MYGLLEGVLYHAALSYVRDNLIFYTQQDAFYEVQNNKLL
jgi:hypothetical protein